MPLVLGIIAGSLALIKLGTLAAWAAMLAVALKLAIAVIFMLAGMLGWSRIKKP